MTTRPATNRVAGLVASLILGALTSVVSPSEASGQSACTVPLAAYLTDEAGTPLVGEVDVELLFYDDGASDALPLECRTTFVVVTDGWLRVLIDACEDPGPDECGVVPLRNLIESSDELWVGIRVGDDPAELTPRHAVGAVPYALRASTADTALTASHATTAGDAETLDGHVPSAFASAEELEAHLGAHDEAFGVPSALAVSASYACALVEQTPICWPPTGLFPHGATYQAIALTNETACGVDTLNSVECFDLSPSSRLGREPVPDASYADVAVGDAVCALTTEGAIVCWGGGTEELLAPPAGTFRSVVIGNNGATACAASIDGGVQCWGPTGANASTTIQADAPLAGDFDDLVVGLWFACALTVAGGDMVCWGDRLLPVADGPFLRISGAGYGICGLRPGGEVECWSDPVRFDWANARVPPSSGYTLVAVNDDSGCAVDGAGEVFCWSAGSYGPTEVPSALRYR